MPGSMTHAIRMVGHVRMRTIYVRPNASPGPPAACVVVAVSQLLSALIVEAVNVRLPYTQHSRDGRLMRLLIDEIVQMPTLPLNLPYPSDPRLRVIHERIMKTPDDPSTAADWASTFPDRPADHPSALRARHGFDLRAMASAGPSVGGTRNAGKG
jgi:hypothetical protein